MVLEYGTGKSREPAGWEACPARVRVALTESGFDGVVVFIILVSILFTMFLLKLSPAIRLATLVRGIGIWKSSRKILKKRQRKDDLEPEIWERHSRAHPKKLDA